MVFFFVRSSQTSAEMESARHVALVGATPLGALLAKRFELTHFEREAERTRLERSPGLMGAFMRHNLEWKDQSPLIYEKLGDLKITRGCVLDNILEDASDIDRLAAVIGTNATLIVVAFEEKESIASILKAGGFYHSMQQSDDIETNFLALVSLLGDDRNFGTFANYRESPDILWAGAWADHPLEAIAQPVRPCHAACLIQLVLELALSRREWKQFCGTHPVSLDRENHESLIHHPYAVSPKVDGTRYFLLLVEGTLFFINRACDVWAGPKHPVLHNFNKTLLDCEITTESTQNHPTLMIIDVLAVQGECKRKLHLKRRIDTCRSLVRFLQSEGAKGFFTVVFQRYLDLHRADASALVSSWDPNDPHNTIDGFVFTPLRLPYVMGRCYHLLKWKPNERNTVDLLFKPPDHVYCLDEHEEQLSVGRVSGVPKDVPSGSIIECHGAGDQRWTFERLRPDKTAPNAQWVLERIVKTISDNITTDDILQWFTAARVHRERQTHPPEKKRRRHPAPGNRYDALLL